MTTDNDNLQQPPSGAGVPGVVPGSYGAQVQLACEEADRIDVLAQKAANPGLFRLYAYASSAVDNAVTIVKYTRQTAFPPAGEFVGQQTRLSVLLKRFKAISDLPSLWATWPQAPGETLSWLAGSSALDVAIQFAKMILATTVISGREIRLDGSYGYGQLPVFPEADARFVKWRDMTFEQILTRQAPKPDVWPTMADIHREYNSLKYKMRAEYEAAVKTADSNRAVKNAPEAEEKTRTRRTAIPKRMEKTLYQESGSRCCMCDESDIHKLTIHHIIPWADNPTHDAKHMIVLCANCHASATAGTISREKLYAAKEGCCRTIPLRTLAGPSLLPVVEVTSAVFRTERDSTGRLSRIIFHALIYVKPRSDRALVFPRHNCNAYVEIPGYLPKTPFDSIGLLPGEDRYKSGVVPDDVTVDRPKAIYLMAFIEPVFAFNGQKARIEISLFPVNASQPVVIRHELTLQVEPETTERPHQPGNKTNPWEIRKW